jgi:hypothetical protein
LLKVEDKTGQDRIAADNRRLAKGERSEDENL